MRVSDLRQARYFGLPKTHLQHVITVTAINVRRIVSWLIGRSGQFPRGLMYVGYLAAALLLLLYLGRLIIYILTNPLMLIPAVLSGFLVNPIWYIWPGLTLWRGSK